MQGIEQRLCFTASGNMTMCVFEHTIEATYELSVEGHPRSMVVRMKLEESHDGEPPPPPVPYIFEFHDGGKELWLCHPVGESAGLPTAFEGPGFIVLHPATSSEKSIGNQDVETEPFGCALHAVHEGDEQHLARHSTAASGRAITRGTAKGCAHDRQSF